MSQTQHVASLGTTAFKNLDDTPLAIVAALGLTRIYGIAEDGAISANSISFDPEMLRSTALARIPENGKAVFKTGKKDLVLTDGVGCVLGQPNSGKTLFADTLATHNASDVTVIRFREPEADSLLYEQNLVRELWRALNGKAKLIFVDSLRTTFYTSGGATGKGGVNMAMFALLTAYDIVARHHGKILLFSLNPMTTDEDAIAFYLEATKGSVTHAFNALEPTVLKLYSRGGKDRGATTVHYAPAAQPSVAVPGKAEDSDIVVRDDDDSILSLYVSKTR